MHPDGNSGVASDLSLEWFGQERVDPMTLEERITRLFEQLREPLYRYLLLTSSRPDLSEELTQETFLRLHLLLRDGKRIANVKAWLFRVAHNLMIDSCRRNGTKEVFASPDEWERLEHSRAAVGPDPEESFLADERLRRVDDAVSKLSAQQRRCLHLRAEGFRYRDIAEILGVSESTVTENLRRALGRLLRDLHAS